MKKKILAAILIIVVMGIGTAIYYTVNKNKNSSSSIVSEFKVKSAFADVDQDMVIQDKDPKDDDISADYIFINFTNELADNKKNDDSNPGYLKSYTLDNSSLPTDTKIYVKNKKQLIIKLKDGTLKGVNTPHSITISKNLIDKDGNKIKGEVIFKLPYSNYVSSDSKDKDSSKNSSGTGTSSDSGNSSNSDNNAKTGDDNKTSSETNTSEQSGDLPAYTVELGKAIPYTTVVMVKLDASDPENYRVDVEGTKLELKENSEGQKVFIGTVKKVYEMDQIKNFIKIEKVQ